MDREKYTKAANILFNTRINKLRLNKLPIDCIPNNIEEAYKIQDELKILYLTLKDNYTIGKKVGCTNKLAQKQINIEEPFYGNLFSKYSSISGCKLISNNFSEPYMEPEFSFRIKEDINIANAPFSFEQIEDLVDTVMGSVEIVDFRFNNELKKIGIDNIISTNGASEYWIKGLKEFKLNEINLSNHPVKVFINNKLIEEGNSSNVLQNPLNSLLWLINKLSLKGETLLKNNVVSTGTCTVAIPLEKNCKVRVDFANMGNIDFEYN